MSASVQTRRPGRRVVEVVAAAFFHTLAPGVDTFMAP